MLRILKYLWINDTRQDFDQYRRISCHLSRFLRGFLSLSFSISSCFALILSSFSLHFVEEYNLKRKSSWKQTDVCCYTFDSFEASWWKGCHFRIPFPKKSINYKLEMMTWRNLLWFYGISIEGGCASLDYFCGIGCWE